MSRLTGSSNENSQRNAVLTGVSKVAPERLAGSTTTTAGGNAVPPMMGRGAQSRRGESTSTVLTHGPRDEFSPRREADSRERDLFT